MFIIEYKMQMPNGILLFELQLMVTELKEGNACDPKRIKEALVKIKDKNLFCIFNIFKFFTKE